MRAKIISIRNGLNSNLPAGRIRTLSSVIQEAASRLISTSIPWSLFCMLVQEVKCYCSFMKKAISQFFPSVLVQCFFPSRFALLKEHITAFLSMISYVRTNMRLLTNILTHVDFHKKYIKMSNTDIKLHYQNFLDFFWLAFFWWTFFLIFLHRYFPLELLFLILALYLQPYQLCNWIHWSKAMLMNIWLRWISLLLFFNIIKV